MRLALAVAVALLRAGAAAGEPLCSEYGAVHALREGGGAPLCLDTTAHAPGAALLAPCDPTRETQWWAALPGTAVLVQATRATIRGPKASGRTLHDVRPRGDPGAAASAGRGLLAAATPEPLCLHAASGSTRRCPAAGQCAAGSEAAACAGFPLEHDDRRALRLKDGRCLFATPGTGRVAPAECAPDAPSFALQACAPLPPLLDGLRDVALGAPVVMSSTSGGSAQGITDGFVEQHGWQSGGCPGVHSEERADERYPWVTIDLGAQFRVNTVQLWNRQPCPEYSAHLCQNRLWAYALFVGDEPPPRPAPEQGAYPANGPPCAVRTAGPLGRYANVECTGTGRYVTLQQTASLDANFPGILNICNIRVLGDPMPPPPPPPPPPAPRSGALCGKLRSGTRLRARCSAATLLVGRVLAAAGCVLALVACLLLRRQWRRQLGASCRPSAARRGVDALRGAARQLVRLLCGRRSEHGKDEHV